MLTLLCLSDINAQHSSLNYTSYRHMPVCTTKFFIKCLTHTYTKVSIHLMQTPLSDLIITDTSQIGCLSLTTMTNSQHHNATPGSMYIIPLRLNYNVLSVLHRFP